MRSLLLLLTLLYNGICSANMAEPVEYGSYSGLPFVSQYVDVLHEELLISINEDFSKATFRVTYLIRSDTIGRQIPLLFYAAQIDGGLEAKFDGKSLAVERIPAEYIVDHNSSGSFSYYYDSGYQEKAMFTTLPAFPYRIRAGDFRYFEVEIPEGEHLIEVTYQAKPWREYWDWISEYSFRYALEPARFWRSFGTLEVGVDIPSDLSEVSTNIFPDSSFKAGLLYHWRFDTLPENNLEIYFTPKISTTANLAITVGPFGFSLLFGLLLLLFQLRFISPKSKLVNSVLGVVFSCLIMAFTLLSFSLIDAIIGEHAGGGHGYAFFIIFLWPIILIVYLGLYQMGRLMRS